MSVICYCAIGVMDLSGVFCGADSGVLQDAFLWNSMGMHTCSVWFSNNSGDGANTFATVLASNASAVVETVPEGGSDDDEEWPEVNLNPRLSNSYNDPSLTYDSGLQELIIDTKDPGCANFATNVLVWFGLVW